MTATEFLSDVVQRAILQVQSKGFRIYTFALYFDHESAAVSVCTDTTKKSCRTVRSINEFNMKHFAKEVARGDYKTLFHWQANAGRSLSLGDFALVNAARTAVPDDLVVDIEFYLSMVRVLLGFQAAILDLAECRENLLFCSSGPDSEVALVWSEIKSA